MSNRRVQFLHMGNHWKFAEGTKYGKIMYNTDGIVIGCPEVIKLGISDGEVMGNIIGAIDGVSVSR